MSSFNSNVTALRALANNADELIRSFVQHEHYSRNIYNYNANQFVN